MHEVSGNWRDVLRVHPAADLFPALDPDQLAELVEDIRTNGLLQPIVYYKEPDGSEVFADGRGRLDALRLLGWIHISNGEISVDGYPDGAWKREEDRARLDPFGYVIGANIRRRHLTAEQRRELIAKLIKADPSKSARQVARSVGGSPTTAVTVRDELIARGDVSNLDTSTDSRGRKQPAHRVTKAAPSHSRSEKPPLSRTANIRLRLSRTLVGLGSKSSQIWTAIHLLAGLSLDVKAQDFLCAYSGAKRSNLLGSARLARDWLNALLAELNSHEAAHSQAADDNGEVHDE